MANNLTIFQRLGQVLGPDGIKQKQKQPQTQRYNIGNEELLKTDSKSEYEKAKLQAQQNKYLGQLWKKVENGLFQQSINYETTRIGSYSDFEAMEFYPTIAAALDVMMEESTTLNDKGRMLNIYSDSKRVKGILEDLFFNRLDFHTSGPMWVRNTCKYGDNFLFLNIDDKHGITGAKQMPNYEMERRESGLFDMISGRETSNTEKNTADKIKFFWRGRDIEFNSWQMAHFRLLGDDRRLPYGTSLLEKARRIWKQLILSEDSMLVYRVTRAPERRVYKIFVGNIDDADVEAYVNTIADRFKRMPIIDPQTGQMDLRYNQLSNDQDYFIPVRSEDAPNPIDTLPGACIALNTRIPLLDGRTLELQEIIKEWNEGNRNLWVYSCDPNTGKLASGLITWAGETRKNAEVIKITLDNGESIITTPDHKWVHRTKGFVEAKDLIVGDSLMPFYRDKDFILKKKYAKKYEKVWDTYKQDWVFTHRMVNNFMKLYGEENYFVFDGIYLKSKMKTIHHMDNNRFNNSPSNLFLMDSKDHYEYHRYELWSTDEKKEKTISKITNGINNYISNLTTDEKEARGKISANNSIQSRDKANKTFNKNPNKENIILERGKAISKAKSSVEFKDKFSIIAKENWKSKEYKDKVFSKKQTLTFSDKLYSMFFNAFKKYGKADLTLNYLNTNTEFLNEFKSNNVDIRSSITNLNNFTHNHLEKMVKQHGFKNYRDWCKETAKDLGYKNVRAWRYYIEKDSKYNHKIISIEWLTDRMDTGTITVDGDEKYHNYHTFATESGVFIKNSNLDQIADIEYLQKNLFTALRVPKPFLGYDETTGEGKNLALQDIRFARTINRIQQSILQELNKIAIIHLYILGFEDDLDNFSLTMNNPSTQAEMLKIEHMQQKVTLLKDAVSDTGNGFAAMSWTRAHRDIMGWSDDEIKEDLLEQRMEKAAAAELQNSANVIKHTGMFDVVDRIYGDYKLALKGGGTPQEGEEESEGGGSGGGGGFGGGGTGGEDLDFGDESKSNEEGEETSKEPSEENQPNGKKEGDEEKAETGKENISEAIKKVEKTLNEEKINLSKKLEDRRKKYKDRFINVLIESVKKDTSPIVDKTKIYDKNVKINKDIDSMIDDIDKMLDE